VERLSGTGSGSVARPPELAAAPDDGEAEPGEGLLALGAAGVALEEHTLEGPRLGPAQVGPRHGDGIGGVGGVGGVGEVGGEGREDGGDALREQADEGVDRPLVMRWRARVCSGSWAATSWGRACVPALTDDDLELLADVGG
jgi:hypothetical protein